ncbi:MAG: EamA family transporter [Parcubacteria group bacterium]|nr:EamA family transporter [Parcubacteria group bacterium]
MNWFISSLAALMLWATYGIFGAKATEVHGEKVSMIFEAIAFLLIAIIVVLSADLKDFQKITSKSFTNATLMGIASSGGFYLLLYALRLSPERMPLIILITGLYPVLTVIITHFIGKPLSMNQWFGIIFVAAGLILINWKK